MMMDVSKISFILLLVAWSVQGNAEGLASKSGRQEPETRIVGGKDAPEGLVPHQAALYTKEYNVFFCGAAIISNRWLLTTAHCAISRKPSELIALVGTLSRRKGGTTYEISKVFAHKGHNELNGFRDDIAVISTKKAIEFNKKVQPLPLPTEDIKSGLSCILSGWGDVTHYHDTRNYTPFDLRYLYVKTLSSNDCNEWFKRRRDSTTISSNQMCTLNKIKEGTCRGDAGGSLVCNGTSAGIVSYNWPCALGIPDVYTNTFMYIPWIEENTKSP